MHSSQCAEQCTAYADKAKKAYLWVLCCVDLCQ